MTSIESDNLEVAKGYVRQLGQMGITATAPEKAPFADVWFRMAQLHSLLAIAERLEAIIEQLEFVAARLDDAQAALLDIARKV